MNSTSLNKENTSSLSPQKPIYENMAPLAQMVDMLTSPAFIKELSGKYIAANTGWGQVLEVDESALINTYDHEILESSLAKALEAPIFKISKEQGTSIQDFLIIKKDGEERSIRIQYSILEIEPNIPAGILGICTDIAETKRKEEAKRNAFALAAAAEMSLLTIEGMVDPVIVLDSSGWVERVNKSYEQLLQREAPPLGSELDSIFPELSKDLIEDILERCRKDGRVQDIATRIKNGKGDYLDVLMNISVLRDSKKSIDSFVAHIRDITEEKQSEALQRALYSISETAYFAKDMDNLYRMVHRIIARLIPAENFMISLTNPRTGALECVYQVDEYPISPEEAASYNGGDLLAEKLFIAGKPVFLISSEIESLFKERGSCYTTPNPRHCLGVPLTNALGENIGVLVVRIYNANQSYEDSHRRVLSFVSSQIAMAIERKRKEEELYESNISLTRLTNGTILALVKAVELRDPYTAGHQQRVSKLAEAIARKLGLNESQIEAIRIAALLHDIGKISVPSELLSKPGQLNTLETEILRQHPLISSELLASIEFHWPIRRYILEHHEKLDGSGYPNGLRGNEISIEGRIICVADVVDAMVSHRPYRPSLGLALALQELETESGKLYDPDVCEACQQIFEHKEFTFEL